MRGKPETEAEKRKRIRDEIEKDERDAEYHRSRAKVMLSYFADQPEKLADPKVKALLSQRQFLAKQSQSEADQAQARLDKIEAAEKQQETMKDIKKIDVGGRTALAQIQSMTKLVDYYQETFTQTQKDVQDIIGEQGKDRNDDLYILGMKSAYMNYVPLLAAHLGMPPEEAQARIQQLIGDSVYNNDLATLNTMISAALGRIGRQ